MAESQDFWREFLLTRTDEAAGALSRLIQFDTVSGDKDPEAYRAWRAKIADGFAWLETHARSLGFVTRNHENRALVIEHAGPAGAPVLGFPIHLDVVPAGEGWTVPPFGGVIKDGQIWGRGTQDDKGPIIEAMYALVGARELAAKTGRAFTKTVRILVFSEEECGEWDDIPFYFEREAPPDFSIVPDATFPITVGEKGVLNLAVDFAWTPQLADRFEIAAGERANVVPAKASLIVGPDFLAGVDEIGDNLTAAPQKPKVARGTNGLAIEFYGVGAHGSLPHKGYSAAADALALAAGIPAIHSHPACAALAWLARAAADLDGVFLGIEHRHEKVGRTTVNLGVLRGDRASLHAVLNIRNPIGIPCAGVESRVRASVEKLRSQTPGLTRAEVKPDRGHREPIYVDPERFPDWIGPMREAYTAVTSRPASLMTIGGTTFAKAFPNAVCFGPVDETDEQELAHEADERITLKAFARNIEVYGRAIVGIALSQ